LGACPICQHFELMIKIDDLQCVALTSQTHNTSHPSHNVESKYGRSVLMLGVLEGGRMQFQRGWRGGGPIKPDQIKPVARTTRRPNRP
ncbi:hypothetical protein RDWZM_003153, partial [Blomia tropicalis]